MKNMTPQMLLASLLLRGMLWGGHAGAPSMLSRRPLLEEKRGGVLGRSTISDPGLIGAQA